MSVNKPEMILIDVDGTLVDSVPDLAYCIDQTMKDLHRSVWGEDAVRNWVGNGVERLVKRALLGTLDGEPDATLFDRAIKIFLDYYADNVCERSQLYPGVREGLEFFKSGGFRLGCVTNKAEQFTLPLLKALDIESFFSIIVCGDTLAKKKPDPLPLLHAANFFKLKPTNCLMIGDSVSDVTAARAAGFQIICMSYGYNHGQDIRNFKPDRVIDSMTELRSIL